MNLQIITTESVTANIHTINNTLHSHVADIKVKVTVSCACHEGIGGSGGSALLILNPGQNVGEGGWHMVDRK
jgi:hypothetical protein